MQSMTGLVAGDWIELSETLKSTGTSFKEQEQQKAQQQGYQPVKIPNAPEDGRFNLILASETTYTLSSSMDTAQWLFHHLKYDTGVGLVSMKRYYFGVGGSTDAFKEASHSFGLTVDLVREYNDGLSNIRDLLRVRLIK